MSVTRHRRRLDTTIDPRTEALMHQVADDIGITSRGAVIDFVFTDWVRLKRAALYAARVTDPGDGHSEEAHETDHP